jgi:endonuclease/exonuclease/phosphatase family metal-dependent hydrolase
VASPGLSFPSWKPQKRIDFILVKRAAETVKVLDVRLLGNSTLAPEKRDLHKEVSSDHLGLWALLDLSPSAPDGRSPTPRRDLPTITPVVNDEL